MPRISPWDSRFRSKQSQPETRTVELPELETAITFREGRDDLWRGQYADLEDLYTFQHAGKKPRKPLTLPDNTVLPGSRELFRQVAAAEVLQVTAEGEEPFSMLDLLGIAKWHKHRWDEIKAALAYLTNPVETTEADPGNSSAGEGPTPTSDAGSKS